MDVEPKFHLHSDVLVRSMDPSFTPNKSEHPSSMFTTIGFDVTITKVPDPPTTDISTPYDCITTLTANADSNLQDFKRSKLNHTTTTKSHPQFPAKQSLGTSSTTKQYLSPSLLTDSEEWDQCSTQHYLAQDHPHFI